MPDRSKVRWSQLKVGLLATAAMIILAVLIFLLTGSGNILHGNVRLRLYVDDASGVATKAPVRLNGFLVGYVDDIRLSGSTDPNRTVEFELSIQQQHLRDIPDDSVATITAASLLGDKFINITRGKSPRPIQPGAELRSQPAQDIPELMAQSANLLATLQNIVRRADTMLADIEHGQGNIGKLLKDEELYNRLNGMAAEGQKLVADIRTGKGTLSRLLYDDSLYEEVRRPIRRIDTMLADLQKGQGTAGKLLHDTAVYDEAQASLVELRRIVAELNSGHGTAGKLLKDEQLYKQMNVLVERIEGTLDRINSGQGTIGQLIVNPQLYESLNGTMREFQSLAKDMRANPKKFLTIRLTLFLSTSKRLIVNADDFGFTSDVNRGIVAAHRDGILTATTLMATGPAFEDAVRLARENPALDIGVHFALVNATSAVTGKPLPMTVGELLRALARRQIPLYEELRAQVSRILAAGITPSHLDTHKHTHLAPPVLDALARVAGEFDIRWVRRPFDFPLTASGVPWTKRLTSTALGLARRRFHRVLEARGCRSTDHFAGFQITGNFRTAELIRLIEALPEGLTELMTHPGYCTAELRTARTRLKESREQELEALTAPETRRALERCGVELTTYRA